MRQRGYAIAFLLVLLAACAGAFLGGHFLWQRLQQDFRPRQDWVPPVVTVSVPAGQAMTVPPPTAEPSATRALTPTLMPPSPVLPTAAATTTIVPGDTPELTPTPASTELAQTRTPTATRTPGSEQVGQFPYTLARPVRHSTGDCPGSYILGQVTDQNSQPLPGVRLWLVDEYGNQAETVTKSGQGDAGHYDFPLFGPPRRFYLSVVDGSGHPISPRVEVPHGVGANSQATCHWVDWQRR